MGLNSETISQTEFINLVNYFADELLDICQFFVSQHEDKLPDTERLFARLAYASKLVEDLLDYHGAKSNRQWYKYRELVASVLNFSGAAFTMKHIVSRISFYEIGADNSFIFASQLVHRFLINTLINLCQELIAETRHLNLKLSRSTLAWEHFANLSSNRFLEFDITTQDLHGEKQHIVRITSAYLNIVREFESLGFYKRFQAEELRSLIPARINEEILRKYEMIIHNLQSSYDTYIGRDSRRSDSIKFKSLRDHISIALHLLELSGRLSHYFERHLFDVGRRGVYLEVQQALCKLVHNEFLLDAIINYAVFYCNEFLSKGKSLAQSLLNQNIQHDEITVGVPVKLGFHSRPCMLVAKIVQHYGGQVEMIVSDDRFDAGSILDLQWAGGKVHRENLSRVKFQGDARALADIKILASINYGEDTMGKGIPLPPELAYLR
ncbi:MAG: HPr family phosphocarrier protein [Deltaproteobacteria bacterium]|nr:HPr family phosphocarrier protein [Deltaproteobacteria bacterium]